MWMNLQTEVKMNRHAFVLAHDFVTTLERSATCKNEIMSQFSSHSGWSDSAFLTSLNAKTSFFVRSKAERGTAFMAFPFDILNILPFALSEVRLRKLTSSQGPTERSMAGWGCFHSSTLSVGVKAQMSRWWKDPLWARLTRCIHAGPLAR